MYLCFLTQLLRFILKLNSADKNQYKTFAHDKMTAIILGFGLHVGINTKYEYTLLHLCHSASKRNSVEFCENKIYANPMC